MNIFKKLRKGTDTESKKSNNSDLSNEEKSSESPQLKLGEMIFPSIKSKNDNKIIDSLKTSNPILTRELFEDLVIVYSIDLGGTFELASQNTVLKYNTSIDNIHQAAMRNLRKLAENSIENMIIDPPQSIEGGKSFTRILLDNNFDSSLILLDELWPQFSKIIGDSVVGVSIPAKNILAISTFSDDNIAYRTMRLFGQNMYENSISEGIQITNDSYVWKDGEWHKFLNTQEQFVKLCMDE